MPKKLRPTVDFMAFKCRTLRVKMGGACSAYGGEERRMQGFWGET